MSAKQPIGVFNEWGKLKEVLVGSHDHDVMPHLSPDWCRYHGFSDLLKNAGGIDAHKFFPELSPAVVKQTNELARVLEGHGIIVHRPRLLTDAERFSMPVGLINQFARDPIVVIGNHIIETNLRMGFRGKEQLGYEDLFRRRLQEDSNAHHVRMPNTSPILTGKTDEDFMNDPRAFLEGGDTFVIGKDILVGFSSLASSPAGAAWLQRYLQHDGYRVHLVPLTTEWLHLDCIFSVIREGLCMCYMNGLKNKKLPDAIKDWEVIEATEEEANKLGCNTICLEPGVVVIGAEHKRLIKEIEKRKGIVIPVPYDKPSQLGGAIRCSTHPLVREI